MTDLSSPDRVIARLEEIDQALAERQNSYESAARSWYTAQREIGRRKARALLTSQKDSVTEKKAEGELAAFDVEGAASQAEYEALKAAVGVLTTRSIIGMAILKAQGRA